MKKFEVGQTYNDGNTFKITGRTEKTVNVIEFQHYGRTNERIVNKQRKFKIQNWEGREVIFIRDLTIEAM